MPVPTNYTWTNGEKPDFKTMNTRLSDMVNFLLNPPLVRLRRITTMNFLTSTVTAIPWDSLEIEVTNMWDSAQPTRITPSVPGWYIGSAGISFDSNITGYREMDIRKNNSSTDKILRVKVDSWDNAGQTVVTRGHMFMEFFNGTTDYVEVTGWQNSGVTITNYVSSPEQQPDFSMRWFAA